MRLTPDRNFTILRPQIHGCRSSELSAKVLFGKGLRNCSSRSIGNSSLHKAAQYLHNLKQKLPIWLERDRSRIDRQKLANYRILT
ncbi:hypothetical protein [Chamaesiphon sp. OTE_8_metabat_110]|uniref:hypothetical protein n=1 Tax=Chamaesiphon sp. OTE_8_metabat_110 TaxID=2964696 RepID=UPI00286CEEDE|nr:hypothetical protein [Chamaesiphon sp. OTE_8_metabat_110]